MPTSPLLMLVNQNKRGALFVHKCYTNRHNNAYDYWNNKLMQNYLDIFFLNHKTTVLEGISTHISIF